MIKIRLRRSRIFFVVRLSSDSAFVQCGHRSVSGNASGKAATTRLAARSSRIQQTKLAEPPKGRNIAQFLSLSVRAMQIREEKLR
jgi:hypothetical protein